MPENIKNKRPGIRKILVFSWPFILFLLVFLSTELAAGHSHFIEKIYSDAIYPFISVSFSSISRYVPFSLWDLFWALAVLTVLACLILIVLRKIRPGRILIMFVRVVAVLYALFYISWGYNYYRPKIESRLNWAVTSVDTTLFRSVMDSVTSQANKNYTTISPSDYKLFDSIIEEGYKRNGPVLKIGYPNGTRRPKKMMFSTLFSRFGVSGYFGPFFNEIHLNKDLLPIDYPFVLAHEKAHQFGITSEAEANFVAFVICTASDDKRVKYSAYQSLLLYFLKDASQMKNYRAALMKVNRKVIDDLRYRQHYYNSLQNESMSKIQTKANDVYLKANKIDEGVRNYDEVVYLVINWSRNSKIY